MILQTLVELCRRENLRDDPDFEPKEVRWVIVLGPNGRFENVEETQGKPDMRSKVRAKVMAVPRFRVRTSGSAANFLVDKAEYVLGFDPDENPKKRVKLPSHRRLFLEFVESAQELGQDDPGLLAILAFLRDDGAVARCTEKVRGKAASNDLFAFRYHDAADPESGWSVHEREHVRAAWHTLRNPSESDQQVGTECLLCGHRGAPVAVHPQVKHVSGGTTSGIAFVSYNASAFESLGLSGNDNAPVCRDCAESYGTALNRLFHPAYPRPNPGAEEAAELSRRYIRLSDNTTALYWASQADSFEDEMADLDYDPNDPAKVEALYQSVSRGKPASLDESAANAFHVLIVTGGQGRATIRGYLHTTVPKAHAATKQYFDDIAIVGRYPNAPKYPPLHRLVRSLAVQGKAENVDADLAGQLFLAILDGRPFPVNVLQAAIRRIHTETENPARGRSKHTQERCALIRVTLNRQLRAPEPYRIKHLIDREITVMLDTTCTNNAYCLGRLFAVLEKLQADAINNPNATITDRFYGAASATPAAVFAALLRKAQHHLSKVPYHNRTIQDVLGLLDPANAFPTTLDLAEQGLFALGYYHQRADLWKKKAIPETNAAASA